jgi:hypothetical protein
MLYSCRQASIFCLALSKDKTNWQFGQSFILLKFLSQKCQILLLKIRFLTLKNTTIVTISLYNYLNVQFNYSSGE